MIAVVAWAEVTDGRVKKPTLEALTLGRQWADSLGLPLWASVWVRPLLIASKLSFQNTVQNTWYKYRERG